MKIKNVFKQGPRRFMTIKPLLTVVPAMLIGLGLGLPGLVAPPALAIDVEIGPIQGNIDTTVSAGISVRVEERDPELIGETNGGTAWSANADDGNLNFAQGDITSANVKVLHEADLRWENYSFFGRFYYFYDWAIMKNDPRFRAFTEQAQRRAGMNIKLLDAYVTGDYELFGRPVTVRVGNQVLSWGESLFIQSGINSINPVDVTSLRVAGAELKEALIPVPMISLNAGVTDNLSIEAFYQFYWDNTEIEPVGTYFATNDFAAPGSSRVMLGFGQAPPDGPMDKPVEAVGARPPLGSWIERGPDREPSHMGQGGVALRYFATWLNDTEFGAYWEHIHSRRPVLAGVTGNPPPGGLGLLEWGLINGDYASEGTYFREFPEDIDIVGVSFNTEIPATGMALGGEVSARLDQPISLDDVEFLFRAISPLDDTLATLTGGETPIFARSQQAQLFGIPGFNEEIKGWQRKDMVQAQALVTQLFGPNLGADQIVFLCEFGVTYFPDLEDKDELRYEGPGTFTSANPWFTDPAEIQPETQKGGFADDLSWGYRIATWMDFNNAIGPITLQPVFAWYHDVDGTTPSPISNFVEDRKQMTLALRATYLNTVKAGISYTMYFGGGQHNLLHDRDFVSLTTSISF